LTRRQATVLLPVAKSQLTLLVNVDQLAGPLLTVVANSYRRRGWLSLEHSVRRQDE
jgi:hypothetical protein